MSGFLNSLKSLASGAANVAKYPRDDGEEGENARMHFSLTPQPGESGFTQWLNAMKMVARLPGGIPPEFRKQLWLTLADHHLEQRGIDWNQAEKICFNEWSNPDDEELGIQIVKDLHRTGCSLFCGAAGRDNQAVLRRVLLGFAHWNKSVGYCQGLNVLAAFVLQVTDRADGSAIKIMINLIEGVLPEGYFADNLRGLSVDMAVFRDLMRIKLPKLSKHLEALQSNTKDKTTGSSYEPPLTNVFTMQWFLTIFCHCLPQDTVLRVWDLIFLEGDEILLKTALAIWDGISDRIMTVKSADEFYSIMGVLTREMLEFTNTNDLIKTIVDMGSLHGVTDLREKHRYNITPWARRLSDNDDSDTEDDDRLALTTAVLGISNRSKKDRLLQQINPIQDREKLVLDISTLKQQYSKLRERQRQAHIILSAAVTKPSVISTSTSQAVNHLLVGKSALVSTRTRQLGPMQGIIPQKSRGTQLCSPRILSRRKKQGITLHWKDTKNSQEQKNQLAATDGIESSGIEACPRYSRRDSADSDSGSTSTELCDDPERFSDSEEQTSLSDCNLISNDDDKSPSLKGSSLLESPLIQSLPNTIGNQITANANAIDKQNNSEKILKSISIVVTDQQEIIGDDEKNNTEVLEELSKIDNNDSKNIIEHNSLNQLTSKTELYEKLLDQKITTPLYSNNSSFIINENEFDIITGAGSIEQSDDNDIISGKENVLSHVPKKDEMKSAENVNISINDFELKYSSGITRIAEKSDKILNNSCSSIDCNDTSRKNIIENIPYQSSYMVEHITMLSTAMNKPLFEDSQDTELVKDVKSGNLDENFMTYKPQVSSQAMDICDKSVESQKLFTTADSIKDQENYSEKLLVRSKCKTPIDCLTEPARVSAESKFDVNQSISFMCSDTTPISTELLLPTSTDIQMQVSNDRFSKELYNNVNDRIITPGISYDLAIHSPKEINETLSLFNDKKQDNLSDPSLGHVIATSPFYPITNFNQMQSLSSDADSRKINTTILNSPDTYHTETCKLPSLIAENNEEYNSVKSFEYSIATTCLGEFTEFKNRNNNINVDTKNRVDGDEKYYRMFDINSSHPSVQNDRNYSIPSELFSTASTTTNISHESIEDTMKERKLNKFIERNSYSLDNKFNKTNSLNTSDNITESYKRCSDILNDLRHLEACESSSTADTNMIRKTGYNCDELKNLEARRQDTFSDSATDFVRSKLNIPLISLTNNQKKTLTIQPKIEIDENSDSILQNYTKIKATNEFDDDRESKLGVWTKVKPRKRGENGRSSSERALKIIQENSAILHKILTCQAKKNIPDLEEISKEITISPINEEISKIFSPILEKMGLNEHEINEELSRINFGNIDQMKMTTCSELDAKINEELSKLSLIDDDEVIDIEDLEEIIISDSSDRREARIDKQINEELSKLLLNYNIEPNSCDSSTFENGASRSNSNDIDDLALSDISTNPLSFKSSSDSTTIKTDYDLIQSSLIMSDKSRLYDNNSQDCYSSNRYDYPNLSPKSNLDIHNELEKLNKISATNILLSASPSLELLEECKVLSPIKTRESHQSFDFQSTITSSLRNARDSYLVPVEQFMDSPNGGASIVNNPTSSKVGDCEIDMKRQILSKEKLEFRVRYEDNISRENIVHAGPSYRSYRSDHSTSYHDSSISPNYFKEEIGASSEYSYEKNQSFSNNWAKFSDINDEQVFPSSYTKITEKNTFDKKLYDPIIRGNLSPMESYSTHLDSTNHSFNKHDALSPLNPLSSTLSSDLYVTEPEKKLSFYSEYCDDFTSIKKNSQILSPSSKSSRKASLTLGPFETNSRIANDVHNISPSPKNQLNPFPIRSTSRKPKELGCKLGLYSPSSSNSNQFTGI